MVVVSMVWNAPDLKKSIESDGADVTGGWVGALVGGGVLLRGWSVLESPPERLVPSHLVRSEPFWSSLKREFRLYPCIS